MKKIAKTLMLAAMLGFVMQASAQTQVGVRDYFQSVGQASLTATTVSHFKLYKATTFSFDNDGILPVTIPADAVMVRSLVGINKYIRERQTLIYDNLFVFSIQTDKGWEHHMPLTGATHNDNKDLVSRLYIDIQWQTAEYESTLPTEADITYIEVMEATGQKSIQTKHSPVSFTNTTMTYNMGDGEKSITTMSFFSAKKLVKQYERAKEMLADYAKGGKPSMKPIMSDHTFYANYD